MYFHILALCSLLASSATAATLFQVSAVSEGGGRGTHTSGIVEGVNSLISQDGVPVEDLVAYRGYNIIVFDRATGDITAKALFDTWSQEQVDTDPVGRMTTFLMNIPPNSVVAVAVWRSANKCEDECFEQLLSLGSTLTRPLKYAESYALIGYKAGNGCDSAPTWITDALELNPGSENAVNWTEPVYVSADIPDDCSPIDNDPCAASPCIQGSCSNVEGGFECSCVEGYTGTLCDEIEILTRISSPIAACEAAADDAGRSITLDVVSEAGYRVDTITSGMVPGVTSLISRSGFFLSTLKVSRGWNIAVMNRATGDVISYGIFDTWAQGRVDNDPVLEMTEFLRAIPEDSVVAMGVWDTGNKCTGECFDELKKLGATLSKPLRYGESYALVGYKAGNGCDPRPDWVTQAMATNPGSKNALKWTEPVYLQVTIPKRCQSTVIDSCSDNPCDRGVCVDLDAGFECSCDEGVTGSLCNEVA